MLSLAYKDVICAQVEGHSDENEQLDYCYGT